MKRVSVGMELCMYNCDLSFTYFSAGPGGPGFGNHKPLACEIGALYNR